MKLLRKYAAALAFIGIAIAGGVAINDSAHSSAHSAALVIYHSQYTLCLRGNQLRQGLNIRLMEVRAEHKVVLELLSAARKARLGSYQQTHSPTDKRAAANYAQLHNNLRDVEFRAFEPINCNTTIKKP